MNKKLLAAAIAGAVTAPTMVQAVDFSISGHINREVRFADDGQGSDIQHVDTTASRSRWRIKGSGDLGNGMQAGLYHEQGIASNRTWTVPLKSADTVDSDGPGDIRHSMIWFSGTWGTINLGHTAEAGNGAMFQSHNGAWQGEEYTSAEHCSGCLLRTTAGGTAGSLYSAFPTVSALRSDLIRYDSPAIGPASFQVSVSNNDQWSVGGFLSQEVGGGSFIMGASYLDKTNRGGATEFGISGGFAFSQGTSINLVYGQRDPVGGGPTYDDFYANLAHSWGSSNVSIGYRTNSDSPFAATGAGQDAQSLGFGFAHSFSKPGVEVYAGYQNFAVDAAAGGPSIEDLNVFHIGSRIKFQ
jgi:predicted porin